MCTCCPFSLCRPNFKYTIYNENGLSRLHVLICRPIGLPVDQPVLTFDFMFHYFLLHVGAHSTGRFLHAVLHSLSNYQVFTLVLGKVPAGTCSRNMFSVHTISCSLNRVLKSCVPAVPARTVPAGTRSKHVLGTNRPLSTPPKRSLNDVKPRTCSKWAWLSTQTAISTESAH